MEAPKKMKAGQKKQQEDKAQPLISTFFQRTQQVDVTTTTTTPQKRKRPANDDSVAQSNSPDKDRDSTMAASPDWLKRTISEPQFRLPKKRRVDLPVHEPAALIAGESESRPSVEPDDLPINGNEVKEKKEVEAANESQPATAEGPKSSLARYRRLIEIKRTQVVRAFSVPTLKVNDREEVEVREQKPEQEEQEATTTTTTSTTTTTQTQQLNAVSATQSATSTTSTTTSSTTTTSATQRRDTSTSRLCKEHVDTQGRSIQVRHGDITGEVVGAIVNAANGHLAHGAGVAGAIVRSGGYSIQKESDAWISKYGTVATGDVAVTGPGRLGCEYIIHAVGPICHGIDPTKDRELKNAVLNSLLKAEELQLASISIPAISSGIFGYPKPRCARVLFDVALGFYEAHPQSHVKQIRFTNFDMETVSIFVREWQTRFEQSE